MPSSKQQKKKSRKQKQKKKAASSSDDELQFLDDIIAQNKRVKQNTVTQLQSDFVPRCTYCFPTIGFEDVASLKEHMISYHKSKIIFIEQPEAIRKRTLKFHRDFYESTGHYKDEVAYKFCKCKNLPAQTTRMQLYLHSIEASHYPLVECARCHVLMEREDC